MTNIEPRGTQQTRNNGKKKKKRLSYKKRITIIVVALLVAILALVCYLFFMGRGGDDKTKSMLDGYTTIAFFGVDNRSNGDYDAGNSDSVMLCNINNETKEVEIISVYRDTLMDVDGDQTFRKCNYAYNHGGVDNSIAMLNRNLDLEIEDYVAVDFMALVSAVDALDGVDVELSDAEVEAMNGGYIGEVAAITGKEAIPVSAGMQHLDGVQATAYCRIRSTRGDDFVRASRQRTVLTQIIAKAKEASVPQLASLITGVFPYIKTSLSADQLVYLATHMKSYNLGETKGFPFDKCTENLGNTIGDAVVPCSLESNVIALHAELYDDVTYEASEEVKSISDAMIDFTGCDENDAVAMEW